MTPRSSPSPDGEGGVTWLAGYLDFFATWMSHFADLSQKIQRPVKLALGLHDFVFHEGHVAFALAKAKLQEAVAFLRTLSGGSNIQRRI